MTDSPIALLLVEDNPGDARLVQETLRQHQDQDQDANANAADAPDTPASARFTLTHVPRLAPPSPTSSSTPPTPSCSTSRSPTGTACRPWPASTRQPRACRSW